MARDCAPDKNRTRADLHRELSELMQASKTSSTRPAPFPATAAAAAALPPAATAAGDCAQHSFEAEFRRSSERLLQPPVRKTSGDLTATVPSSRIPAGSISGKTACVGAAGTAGDCSGAFDSSTSSSSHMHMQSMSSDGAVRSVEKGGNGPPGRLGGTRRSGCSSCCSTHCGGHCVPWLPVRAIAAALKRQPSIWITSLLVMLLLCTAGVVGVMLTAANETAQRRLAAEGFAINAGVAFERQLNQMFGPLLSLSVIIQFQPDYKAVNASFDAIARKLLDQMPTNGAVTTLLAAPQGVLRNFYPLEGYCQDACNKINVNLFTTPDRRAFALKTVEEGTLLMQGPMVLSQGYFGVVGRLPIFISPAAENETWGPPDGPAFNCSACYNATTKTRFWGFVNAVINLDTMLNGSDSRLADLKAMGYRYQMHRINPKTDEFELIAISRKAPEAPVSTSVHVPGGCWTLLVSPENGWVPVWRAPILAVVVLISCLFGLLLGAILVSSWLQRWLQSANDALAAEKTRMDVLLARQYNLISCVLQQEEEAGGEKHRTSVEKRTLAKIEDMRREIGASNGATGVDELQLLDLMDEGTYGKVFRGMWRGSVVAIKSMILPARMSSNEKRERMAIMEAAISSAMNHPNIVQTYTYIIKPGASTVGVALSSDGGSSSLVTAEQLGNNSAQALDTPEANAANVHNFEVSLVLEFCDGGSLRTALDAGAFFAEDNSLNYAAILDTAADVARAMVHLHRNQVLHSDLKVRNVLLKTDVGGGRGYIAKVADFGLAVRMDNMDSHVSAFQGTMSHMPPEALLHGRISKAGDVYSFGITLWELFTGGQAYQGIPRALVGHKVAVLGLRPTLPSFTPADYRQLTQDCWHQDPDKRPQFEQVLSRLLAMRHHLGSGATPPLQRYTLQPRASVTEKRPSSEQHIAEAQANGLVQLGSYYVNMSMSGSTQQPLQDDNQQQQQEEEASTLGSINGSAIRFGSTVAGTHNGNGAGAAPRSQRRSFSGRSMLTAGTELETIADTECEEPQHDFKDAAPLQQYDSSSLPEDAVPLMQQLLLPTQEQEPQQQQQQQQQQQPAADIETGGSGR